MNPIEQAHDQELENDWKFVLQIFDSEGYESADAFLSGKQDRLRQNQAQETLAKCIALRAYLASLANRFLQVRILSNEALLLIGQLQNGVPQLEVSTRLTLVDTCLKLRERVVIEDEIFKCVSIASAQAQIDAQIASAIWEHFCTRMTEWRRFKQLCFYWKQYIECVAIRQSSWNQAVAMTGLAEAYGMAGDKIGFIEAAARQMKLMAESNSTKRFQPLLVPLVRSCIAFSMTEPLILSSESLKKTLEREPLLDGDVPMLLHVARAEILRVNGKPTEALKVLTSGEVDQPINTSFPGSKLSSFVRARCHDDLGDTLEARAAWLDALVFADKTQPLTPRLRLEALSGAARANDTLGKYAEALPAYEEAARLAEQILPDGDFELSLSLYNLAEAERITGRDDWSAAMYEALLLEQGQSRTGTRFYALLLRKLGEHELASGSVEKAASMLSEALGVYEVNEFEVDERYLRIVNRLRRAMGKLGHDASPILRGIIERLRSNTNVQPEVVAEALLDLATIETEQGQLEMAVSLLDEAALAEAGRQEPNDGTLRLRILDLRLVLCIVKRQMDRAIELASEISEINDARFIELFHAGSIGGARQATADARVPVERLVWALSKSPVRTQEQVAATYTLAIRRKGIDAGAFRLRNDSGLPDRSELERRIQARRAELARQILIKHAPVSETTSLSELDRDQRHLALSVPEYRLRARLLEVTAADIIDEMSVSRTILIDVMEVQGLNEEKVLVAFIINGCPDSPITLVSLGNSSEISLVVDRLVDSIESDQPIGHWSTDAKYLAKVMLAGIDLQWAPDQLVFAPEGPLLRLPIDILLLNDGHHVLDRFATRIVLSGREALSDRNLRRMSRDRLVIANPSFGTITTKTHGASAKEDQQGEFPFEQLPGTAREGEEVLRRIGEAILLTQHEVTKDRLTGIRSPEILHIATHGFAVPLGTPFPTDDLTIALSSISEPLLRCGLALTNANAFSTLRKIDRSEKFILWGTDILELDVRGTELVYLSACHSGVGDISVGPASSSLAIAFWLAGARSIVMTNWTIGDDCAVLVASTFYEQVISGKSYMQALRAAKIAARQAGASACDWAAYSLFGESTSLFEYGGLFVQHVDGNKLTTDDLA